MLFQDHEKKIYTPPGSQTQFDPLDIDRELTIASSGRLKGLLSEWTAASDGLGDVSNMDANRVMAAIAEMKLVEITRKVFKMKPFPETLSAECLEVLTHYLEWMEGKGEAGGKPQS